MLIKSFEDVNKAESIQEKDRHHESAEAAYTKKKEDKLSARDWQQCLLTSDLKTYVAFYKRQMWTFSLTLYDELSFATNCMWDESAAKRGTNNISSCIYRTLLELPEEISHIVLYSNTYGGQNKNTHVVSIFFSIMKKTPSIKTIDRKFMVPRAQHDGSWRGPFSENLKQWYNILMMVSIGSLHKQEFPICMPPDRWFCVCWKFNKSTY